MHSVLHAPESTCSPVKPSNSFPAKKAVHSQRERPMYLHNEEPCFCLANGMAHTAENCNGVLVRPVVQDEPQEVRVAVRASWQGLCTGLPPSRHPSSCGAVCHGADA